VILSAVVLPFFLALFHYDLLTVTLSIPFVPPDVGRVALIDYSSPSYRAFSLQRTLFPLSEAYSIRRVASDPSCRQPANFPSLYLSSRLPMLVFVGRESVPRLLSVSVVFS